MNPALWLQDLLVLMGYPALTVKEAEVDGLGNHWLVIDSSGLTGQQVDTLTGQNGFGLDALQYLANQLFHQADSTTAYIVELAGFREKQLSALALIASQAITQVRETREPFAISHLSPSERRYIHLMLKVHTDLETFSQGEEPNRQLIVQAVT